MPDDFPRLTVDAVVVRGGRLLAIRRGRPPFRGRPALPGGFVNLGETLRSAVVREVREETGLDVEPTDVVGVFSAPGRDPRGAVVSVAFRARIVGGRPRAGDDAADLLWLVPSDLPEMAFDHREIVRAALRS